MSGLALSPEIAEGAALLLSRPQPEPGSYADKKLKEAREHQHAALQSLIELDQGEHEDELVDVEEAAKRVLDEAGAVEKRLAAAVKPAITEERRTEDRVREAAEWLRLKVEDHRAVAGKASPQEQSGALGKIRDAEQVLQGERAAHEGAVTARAQAEADLEAARQAVREAKTDHDAAWAKLDNPGRVPLINACQNAPVQLLQMALQGHIKLTKFEIALCAASIRVWAEISGLNEDVRAEARREAKKEHDEQNAGPRVVNGDIDATTIVHVGPPPGSAQRGPEPITHRPGSGAPVMTPAVPFAGSAGIYTYPGVRS